MQMGDRPRGVSAFEAMKQQTATSMRIISNSPFSRCSTRYRKCRTPNATRTMRRSSLACTKQQKPPCWIKSLREDLEYSWYARPIGQTFALLHATRGPSAGV
jgi:hypothetical protein